MFKHVIAIMVFLLAGCGSSRSPLTSTPPETSEGEEIVLGDITAKSPVGSLDTTIQDTKTLAEESPTPEVTKALDSLGQLKGAFEKSWNSRRSDSGPANLGALYQALLRFSTMADSLQANNPGLAEIFSRISRRWPVWQYVDPRIGARAYSSPRSPEEAKTHMANMRANGFFLEGVAFYLPKRQSARCTAPLYEYVYSDPAVGYLYAYLTRDPNGERGSEPASYRASWGTVGIICESDPGNGALPLVRLSVRNGQIPGSPYIGVSTLDVNAIGQLTAQGWNRDYVLGWAYPN